MSTIARCGPAIVQVVDTPATNEDVLLDGLVEGFLSSGRRDGDREPTTPQRLRVGKDDWTGRHVECIREGKTILFADAVIHQQAGRSRAVLCASPRQEDTAGRCRELLAYFGRYGTSRLPHAPPKPKPSLPAALSALHVPKGCDGPAGPTFDFLIRCDEGELTWGRRKGEEDAARFLAMTLELQRRWLKNGLTETQRPCVVAGAEATCFVLRGKVERGLMTAVFASTQLADQWGIVNCTYLGGAEEVPRVCAEGLRFGAP